jgi:lipopolysaccharide/colanic/teichoic acid biosynthesis glycosyltransferase
VSKRAFDFLLAIFLLLLTWPLLLLAVVDGPAVQPMVTAGGDSRITRSGHILRKFKLDELPQLFNVMGGEMSFVGPRPEVQRFVDVYPVQLRDRILSIRPGITDPASILFRNESEILDAAEDAEREYIDKILPVKLELYVRYVDDRSFFGDLMLIAKTVVSVLFQSTNSLRKKK